MTADHELAVNVGFLWAVAYMFLLAGVFGFGVWWILKDIVRWVLCEPHLRWRRAGRLVGRFAVFAALAAVSKFLGGIWPLTFMSFCFLSALVSICGVFSGNPRRSVEFWRLPERPLETLPAGRGEDHG